MVYKSADKPKQKNIDALLIKCAKNNPQRLF